MDEFTSRDAFLWAFRELDPACTTDGEGHHIDEDLAWAVYHAHPERWLGVTMDNPEGNPLTALISADGPHWVDDEPHEGTFLAR